jgi:hypothetical protein
MNNTDDMGDDTPHPGDNAPFYFDRYPPDTARWVADLGDEVSAKAGESSFDWRRLMCEKIVMGLHDGVPHSFVVAEQIIAANTQGAKYLEQQYEKYDRARSAVIQTGPTSDTSHGEPENPGGVSGAPGLRTQDRDQSDRGKDVGTGSQSTSGAGKKESIDTTVTVVGGCGTGLGIRSSGQNTGIGHQGTLFIIHWSEYVASIPARRKKAKAENQRLIEVRTHTDRQIRLIDDELMFLDLAEAASPVLENLINTHRSESSIAGVLRAAGVSPQGLGLTEDAVRWLDTQLKAA